MKPYSGHPLQRPTLNSTMDNFLRNRWNDVQTFITKPLCSGHQSIADITFMSQITLLPRTGPIRNIYTFYFRYCLTVWFKFSSIFSDLFWSIKKKIAGISSPYSPPWLMRFPAANTSKAQRCRDRNIDTIMKISVAQRQPFLFHSES